MSKKLYFACDRCFNKVSFREVFKFGKSSKTTCIYCKSELRPIQKLSFNARFFIGFLATVIPFQLIFNYTKDISVAFLIAIFCSILSVLGLAVFTYNSTEFTSIP